MPKAETDTNMRRWFHAAGRRFIMLRPDKQRDRTTVFMAVLNDADKRLHELADQWQEGVPKQKAIMEEYFKDVGWESERVIKEMNAANDFYYAHVKMDHWSKGRVVLLGDAVRVLPTIIVF